MSAWPPPLPRKMLPQLGVAIGPPPPAMPVDGSPPPQECRLLSPGRRRQAPAGSGTKRGTRPSRSPPRPARQSSGSSRGPAAATAAPCPAAPGPTTATANCSGVSRTCWAEPAARLATVVTQNSSAAGRADARREKAWAVPPADCGRSSRPGRHFRRARRGVASPERRGEVCREGPGRLGLLRVRIPVIKGRFWLAPPLVFQNCSSFVYSSLSRRRRGSVLGGTANFALTSS